MQASLPVRGRGRAAGVVALVGLLLGGCAHQGAPPLPGPRGLERSVFPLFVGPGRLAGPLDAAAGEADRACSAVYVAPHLLATSASAFGEDDRARNFFDPEETRVLDGSFPLAVERLSFFDSGLVLVHTREPGAPIPLRPWPVALGQLLHRIGYAFHADRGSVRPRADWDLAPGVVNARTLAGGPLLAATPLHPGLCGAVLLDDDGALAGIVRGHVQAGAVIIDAQAIRTALEQVGAQP
jgi:hypothetical protein